ncbi:MAG: hypothetical protein HY921_12815 [Elusimicrobia bacterium]|nr:hypothetical protein [Elusimicrobiota bacterium]
MLRAARFPVVLWAALLFCSCSRTTREIEPNDDYGQATPIRAGLSEGTIAHARDVDIFRIEIKQKTAALSAHLEGVRGVDFALSFRDGLRRELKRYDETAVGGDEEMLDLGVSEGVYYIVVSNKNEKGANPSQEYQLRVRLDPGLGHEREPNDSPQTASVLELPGVTKGHFFPSKNLLAPDKDFEEEDWFQIDIPQSGLFLLNLVVSEVSQIDPSVEIYDSNSYKVRESDAGGLGEGESLRHFGVRGPAAYYLRLRSKRRNASQPNTSYEILSELVPYQGRTEFEPNDQRTDATPLEVESISGVLSSAQDADWYKLSVQDDLKQILRANLSGVEGLDLVLRFYDSFGNELLSVDNMGMGQAEVLTGVGVGRGDWYFSVSEKSGRKANPGQSYSLGWSRIPFPAGLEYEINDSSGSAQPIKIGESVDGYLAPKGDADWYTFNVYHKGLVLFDVTGVLNVRGRAALYDQELTELGVWTGSRAGENISFEKELEPGTYDLELRAADPAQSNVRDKYTVGLRIR